MNFIFQIIIGIVLSLAAAFLAPRPKQPKQEVEEMENPTADAGREIPVIFGTVMLEAGNIIAFFDKSTDTEEIDA